MSTYADLHLHTNHSDGADAPAVVVERAAEMSFSAMAITDHDTVSALSEAEAAANSQGLQFISGVELSTRMGKVEVHVLGYGIDPNHDELLSELDALRTERLERAHKIVEKLNQLDILVDWETLVEKVGEQASIGRVHIAKEIHALGHTKTVQDAFDKYIGMGKRAYVAKAALTIEDAIDLIHDAGGVSVLAHAGLKGTRRKITQLLTHPFDGIEVYHSAHNPGQSEEYLTIAEERGLLVTGGSDCHGAIKGGTGEMGKVRLPMRYVDAMRERLG